MPGGIQFKPGVAKARRLRSSESPCFLGVLAISSGPARSLGGLPLPSHFWARRAVEAEDFNALSLHRQRHKDCPATFWPTR